MLFFPFIHVPLERDEGAYGYMAQRILAGEIPYRDAFDHKPPLIYFIYAGLIKTFGNSIEAIRIPTLIYSLLTTLAVFYLGFLLFGSGAGLLAALLFAIFSGGPLIQGASSNTEVFMILPLVLAVIFFLRGKDQDLFLAGLFSGTAVMIKQVAGLNLLVLLAMTLTPFFPLSQRERGRLFGFMVLGSLIVPIFFLLYFWSRGALGDLIYQVLLVNRLYLRSLPFGPLARSLHGVYVTYVIAGLENGLLWVFAFIGGLLVFLRDRENKLILLVFWTIASLLAAAASGLFFGHYYIQLIPGLCLLAAYGLSEAFKKGRLLIKIVLVIMIIALSVPMAQFQYPFYFQYSPEEISVAQYGKASYVISRRLADELRKIIKPKDKIFVWAADPEFYFYLGKKAPTKYFNYLSWMETEDVKQEIISAVLDQRPEYIIWTQYTLGYKPLVDFVQDNYRLVMRMARWQVFQKIK